MNDVLAQVIKIAPTYVLIGLVFVWVLVRALPDSAQFFGDLLPHRRRLSRARATLESIKVKAEAIEIAQKHNIPLPSTLDDAIKDELAALLTGRAVQSAMQVRRGIVSKIAEASYSIVVSLIVVLAMFGMLSSASTDFKWQNAFISILAVAFAASLAGCYVGIVASRDVVQSKRLSIGSYLMVAGFGYGAGSIGLLLGGFLTEGAYRILYSVSIITLKQ